ncbi:hypothetical protein S83_021434 [Arachis hypogaea]
MVVYFDLGKETYSHFFLPYTDSDDYFQRMNTYLCILRNCLSVCYEHLVKACIVPIQSLVLPNGLQSNSSKMLLHKSKSIVSKSLYAPSFGEAFLALVHYQLCY